MAITYSDQEIESLLQEHKSLLNPSPFPLTSKRGNSEKKLDLTGDLGTTFRLILRQNNINSIDFSIILGVPFPVPQSKRIFCIRRYDGKSHEHTNQLEDVTFYDFHIHFATERYQNARLQNPRLREEAYAEPTDRFDNFADALHCLMSDANFEFSPFEQGDILRGFSQ